MALSLHGIEPVEIKGRLCVPKIDAETKLRLSNIKSYDKVADGVLAGAFPDDEEYVRRFLADAPVVEKEILHAYLVGGEHAVKVMLDGINDNLQKIIATAVETQNG